MNESGPPRKVTAVTLLLLMPVIWNGGCDAAAQRATQQVAVERIRESALAGDIEAQYSLALEYSTGKRVPQDDVEAIKWFRAASAKGHTEAMYALGAMYGAGQGVKTDYVETARWHKSAAEKGNVDAQFSLGMLYGTGTGVKRIMCNRICG